MTRANGRRRISRTHGRTSASRSERSEPVSRAELPVAAHSSSASSASRSLDGHQR